MGGGTWSAINSGLTFLTITSLALDRSTPSTLFAGTDGGGLFISTNGGDTWRPVGTGIESDSILSVFLDTATPPTLYAGTNGNGVYVSVNGGETWDKAPDSGMTSLTISSLAATSGELSVLFAGTSGGGVNVYTGRSLLTVTSSGPSSGVPITLSQKDLAGNRDGASQFSRTYLVGSALRMTAPAMAGGNSFNSWSGCDVSDATQCGVTLLSDRIVTARYNSPYTLTVAVQGSGAGSVNSVPPPTPPVATIACSTPPQTGICSTTQPFGAEITLAATPDSKSLFRGWSGDCLGSGTCAVTMSGPKQVTATFAPLPPVRRIGAIPRYYEQLQTACNEVTAPATIQVRVATLVENLTLIKAVPLVITGGYDAGYTTQAGYTVLKGSLTVNRGSLVVDRLILQ